MDSNWWQGSAHGKLLDIILCLRVPERVVFPAFVRDEFTVRSLLDHCPLMKYKDLIAELTGGQAVADIDRRLVSDNLVEFRIDLCFRYRVQGRCRLINKIG